MSSSTDGSSFSPAEPVTLTRHRSFVLFWCARTSTTGALQMLSVAVGWQLYEMTNNPLDLGISGLVQFIPLLALTLVVGQVADRYDRRALIRLTQATKALAAIALAVGTAGGWLTREWMFVILFVIGGARAFEMPIMHAIVPDIVPQSILPRAIAASATAQQTAIICGPAIGGFFYYRFGPVAVYALCAVTFVTAAVLVSLVQVTLARLDKRPVTMESLLAGFTYIRDRPLLLGVISLDLFAVMLAGVTALLPVYARDILETDAWGLGLLRSSPAIGALTMSVVLSHRTIASRTGYYLFASVAGYGAAIVVFGLSTSLAFSMVALAAYGAVDAVSVVIRHSLVLTRTPNEMLGRVMSVNSLFTGASGMLGDFRAGAMAAWLGAVPAVVLGGIGAILVTLAWMRLFPQLPRIDKIVKDKD
jgi:MFS family permease